MFDLVDSDFKVLEVLLCFLAVGSEVLLHCANSGFELLEPCLSFLAVNVNFFSNDGSDVLQIG